MSVIINPEHLGLDYRQARQFTERITHSLSPEDCMVQSMEDASPVRWHLAHTTWFFETFILKETDDYKKFHPEFSYLFNSYYNAVGDQFPRPQRGVISRPGLADILEYRQHVDNELMRRMESEAFAARWAGTIKIGINHEQQHQELILTDFKHALSANPILPVFEDASFERSMPTSNKWITISAGNYEIGHQGDRFSFDNELPVHKTCLHDAQVSRDLVTCGQYIDFINDGGYQRPDHWLSLGWSTVQEQGWKAPLYWVNKNGVWMQFTLAGIVPVQPDWPVCHISYFEADAFARWRGERLPTEFEWEIATRVANGRDDSSERVGQFADKMIENNFALHPTQAARSMMGGVWQWTSSSYQAYPGFQTAAGAIGEYNGKFMCNQYVLRGGSVASSSSHIRPTYRNFFQPTPVGSLPDSVWQDRIEPSTLRQTARGSASYPLLGVPPLSRVARVIPRVRMSLTLMLVQELS